MSHPHHHHHHQSNSKPISYGCVINVSSGDGELAYLHSVAAKRLCAARSLEVSRSMRYAQHTKPTNQSVPPISPRQELERYTAQVASKQAGPGRALPRHEIAHLRWPAYCFSKATLNAATRLLHAAEEEHRLAVQGTKEDPLLGRVRHGDRAVRVVALCPGDVATGGWVRWWCSCWDGRVGGYMRRQHAPPPLPESYF